MNRWLLVLITLAFLASLLPSFADRSQPENLGSGKRVPEPVAYSANPSPGELDLRALDFELVAMKRATNARTREVRHRATRPRSEAVGASGSVNGYPCGGTLPTCHVLACESGGNPTAQNPHSSASGLWQILDGTWNGFGGYSRAMFAPADVQNEKARLLWRGGAGASHWRSCL